MMAFGARQAHRAAGRCHCRHRPPSGTDAPDDVRSGTNGRSPSARSSTQIKRLRGRKTVLLATGDPSNYGVARKVLELTPVDEVEIIPHISAFSLAAARLGWSLPDCDTLTLHGRPAAQIEAFIQPGVRLIALTENGATVADVARRLVARGFGQSRIIVLENMGGPGEAAVEPPCRLTFSDVPIPISTRLASNALQTPAQRSCRACPAFLMTPIEHDGQLTKREVRAATLAALGPTPDALLWDVGAGCGSIAIEWMRAARGARAIASNATKIGLSMLAENADRLGAPRINIVAGAAPDALAGLERPDAVFIGGGMGDPGVFETSWEALKPGGRMVGNVVTLEGELHVIDLQEKHGGDLVRIDVSVLSKVGRPARAETPHVRPAMAGDQAMSTLYGLGVGPGDPELMTIKAWRIIGQVPVIAYPAANGGDSLARSIAAPFIPEDAIELPLPIPMRTEREPARDAYDESVRLIAAHLDAGRDVAFLCEGDPFFYGSFMYLHERLEKTHEITVVPRRHHRSPPALPRSDVPSPPAMTC